MTIRVALCQVPCRAVLDLPLVEQLLAYKPDFVCLPEYFFTRLHLTYHEEAPFAQENLSAIRDMSSKLNCTVIGGSFIEKADSRYWNRCYIVNNGDNVGNYAKINLFGAESDSGISAGTQYGSFQIDTMRIGVLICADVLNPRSFEVMGEQGCDIVFVPTTSPRKAESVEEKHLRDERVFVRGARQAGCFIVKCCAVGEIFGHPVQGRSLVASPNGIVARTEVDQEEESLILMTELEIAAR